MLFMGLKKFPSIPKLMSVFVMKGCCYYIKMQLFSLFLSSFSLFISFESLVGHKDDLRKEEATFPECPVNKHLPPPCPVCTPDLMVPLLFWHKLHPSAADLLYWPTISWFWVPDFLSLFFRVQTPLLLLSRCPRLLWQLLMFGKLKAIFQPVEFPFHTCTLFDSTNIS